MYEAEEENNGKAGLWNMHEAGKQFIFYSENATLSHLQWHLINSDGHGSLLYDKLSHRGSQWSRWNVRDKTDVMSGAADASWGRSKAPALGGGLRYRFNTEVVMHIWKRASAIAFRLAVHVKGHKENCNLKVCPPQKNNK